MRTLKGFDALNTAKQYDVFVYDLVQQREQLAEEVRKMIQSGERDPGDFVLYHWPDNDQEAEDQVLQAFHNALLEFPTQSFGVNDILTETMHPEAGEMAAQRLRAQSKLVRIGPDPNHKGCSLYEVPRSVYLTEKFLAELRQHVCLDCGRLDTAQAFHQECLINIVKFIQSQPRPFTLGDITTVVEDYNHFNGEARNALPWVQKVSNAIRLFKGVTGLRQVIRSWVHSDEEDENPSVQEPLEPPTVQQESFTPQGRLITKQDLIRYLETVEFQTGPNVDQLEQKVQYTERQLAEKDRNLKEAERKIMQLEEQLKSTRKDLKVLSEALSVAKRVEMDL